MDITLLSRFTRYGFMDCFKTITAMNADPSTLRKVTTLSLKLKSINFSMMFTDSGNVANTNELDINIGTNNSKLLILSSGSVIKGF
jgi:hypothetical protein